MDNIFFKGDILEAKDRSYDAGRHYIIFYEGNGNNEYISDFGFIGGIITHKNIPLNKKMKEKHFEKYANNGDSFKIVYDKSYLVIAKLIKPGDWGPYTKVGQLTSSGISFFEEVIKNLSGENWDEYKVRTSRYYY